MKLNSLVYIGIGVALLVGLFFLFKPQKNTVQNTKQVMQPQNAMNANKKVFTVVVKNKKLVSGDGTLTATEGDTVTINITSDIAEELHLHGYDKSVEFEKDTQAQLTFTADKTGRFPFELENSKIDLGVLDVEPK